MKSTLFFLIACSIMTLIDAIVTPPRLDKEQEVRVHHWIDSLEDDYKRDCVYSRLTLELDRRLTSSQMQVDCLKASLPAVVTHRKFYPAPVFFTSAQ